MDIEVKDIPIGAVEIKDHNLDRRAKVSPNNQLHVLPSGQFSVPEFDEMELQYYGDTNNIQYQIFKKDGNAVSALFFTYVNGAVADDDRIASIQFD